MTVPTLSQARRGGGTYAIIGAGGLGGPAAYALMQAGAEKLLLCDHDTVELSNLQRQVHFTTADLGRRKIDALADELCRRGYPAARIEKVAVRFDRDSGRDLLRGWDVAVEGTDDPSTKFAVNDVALALGIPFAIGGIDRYRGQVVAVSPSSDQGCYRCLFEEPPGGDEAPSCAEAGVLGAVVAVVGGALARAALALQRGELPTRGQLWLSDDLAGNAPPRYVHYARREGCSACSARSTAQALCV